ncbi:unnamed protein product [Effrenium voratum]|nr:unnamed protein product [Effrenium voratum]
MHALRSWASGAFTMLRPATFLCCLALGAGIDQGVVSRMLRNLDGNRDGYVDRQEMEAFARVQNVDRATMQRETSRHWTWTGMAFSTPRSSPKAFAPQRCQFSGSRRTRWPWSPS